MGGLGTPVASSPGSFGGLGLAGGLGGTPGGGKAVLEMGDSVWNGITLAGAMPGAGTSGLGMPGLQGTGLDATPEKSFVKMSTDPATLHQAFHYADIAATEPYASDGKHLLTPSALIFLTSHRM